MDYLYEFLLQTVKNTNVTININTKQPTVANEEDVKPHEPTTHKDRHHEPTTHKDDRPHEPTTHKDDRPHEPTTHKDDRPHEPTTHKDDRHHEPTTHKDDRHHEPTTHEDTHGLVRADLVRLINDLENVSETLKKINRSLGKNTEIFFMLQNFDTILNSVKMVMNAV